MYAFVGRAGGIVLAESRDAMRRRSRLLRVAKWGGVAVCGLLATAWIVSVWNLIAFNLSFGSMSIDSGQMYLAYLSGNPQPSSVGVELYPQSLGPRFDWNWICLHKNSFK